MAIIHRGDIVICALAGDYGKPRPAVVVQSDLFNPTHASITVCPVTSHLIDAPLFRLPLPANSKIGMERASQIMVDKMVTISSDRIGRKVGTLNTKQEALLGACRTYEKSTARQGNGPKHPDFSLHSYHYAPQNHAILTSIPHLLATIPLSPTDS